MSIQFLEHLFRRKDHKEIMLIGLYLSSMVLFIALGIVSGIMGYQDIFWINFSISVVNALLFYVYIKWGNTQRYALFLILIVETDSAFMMLNQHFSSFVTIYPFFIIFGFFFFFKLKTAVWMTLLHLLYWLTVTTYGHMLFPDNPIFHVVSLANIIVSSIIATVFAYFYHISTEITYEKLEHANRQKEILLKEIHHRIKNNLNKISSLLGLQIVSLKSEKTEDTEEVLRKSKLRIEAMAMVHESLYRTDNLVKVNFDNYIRNLVILVSQTYDKNIPIKIDSGNTSLSLDRMMKLGLIINELLTNSMKHSDIDTHDKTLLSITLSQEQSQCTLLYHQHNQQTIDIASLKKRDTLGMKVIELTVKEMDGTMKVSNGSGLKFVISFDC